jgi:hypothetical protein
MISYNKEKKKNITSISFVPKKQTDKQNFNKVR